MMYFDKVRFLHKTLNQQLNDNRLKSVQLFLIHYDGHMAFKFTCLENSKRKDKVKALCDQYCESMMLVKETKTTLTYAI